MKKYLYLLTIILYGCSSNKLHESYKLGMMNLTIKRGNNRFITYDQGEESVIGYTDGHYLVKKDTLFLFGNPIDSAIQIKIDTTNTNKVVVQSNLLDKRVTPFFFINGEKISTFDYTEKVIGNVNEKGIDINIKIPFPAKIFCGSCTNRYDTLYANKTIPYKAQTGVGLNIQISMNINYFNLLDYKEVCLIRKKELVSLTNPKRRYLKTSEKFKNLDSVNYLNYCCMP